MKPVLTARDVAFSYAQGEAALQGINLSVGAGECVVLCGKSGSGKTTISRLFNGLSPDFVEGELGGEAKTFELVAGEAPIEDYVPLVGSVFQNPKTQYFHVNTTSELAFACENMGVEPAEIRRRIASRAEAFKITHLLDRRLHELSGGEKQQIAFVAAGMLDSPLLILDEITSNLDRDAIEKLTVMIKQMKREGVTFLLTEHRLAWTRAFADRYVLIEDGKLIRDWTLAEFDALSDEERNALGLRSFHLDTNWARIQDKITAVGDPEAPLRVHDLAVGYDKPVQSGLTGGFAAGQITGIMGHNGVGKSTLARTLIGLMDPLEGSISWEGKPLTKKEALKLSFLVMQNTGYQLFTDSVEDEVLMGAKHPEKKDEILEQLNIKHLAARHPMSLSDGQKQRVAIASAILSGKKILIFDEPTSGMDHYHMTAFGEILADLKQFGVVMIVISHDEDLMARWCDRIVVLD